MKNVVGKAKVQVTVEVETASWGADCAIGQLYDQAAREGLDKVYALFKSSHGFRIIGEPKVIGVITEEVR